MMLRYFCLVAAGPVGDLGYAYMTALRTTGIRLRAIPIGGAVFGADDRWTKISELFAVPMSVPYVNVVCAAAGVTMGSRTAASSFSNARDLPAELQRVLGPQAERPVVVVYEPKTAFAGLYTVGCKNVAILRALPLPDGKEVTALMQYDRVLCPTAADCEALSQLGISAQQMPPSADGLRYMLEELCGSDTFATTAPSPATDAPPATTSSPSTASTASSSRSSRSAAASSLSRRGSPSDPLSRGMALSIRSSFRGLWSLVRRMWRSITRSRAP